MALNFIKDKENLFIHNIWSGTDHLKTTTGFTTGANATMDTSTDWSTNGERSFKLTRNQTTSSWGRAHYPEPIKNQQINSTCTIKTGTGNVTIYLLELSEDSSIINSSQVTVPSNTTQKIELSLTTTETNMRIATQFSPSGNIGQIIYVDDITLKIQ